jgi:stage V sporulation protein B
LYQNPDAGTWLRRFSLMVPMLYCDAITDAMTKGLGQQKACVRYNIITSSMDVVLLFILLPRYGMGGYFISFLVTHALNFFLSLRKVLQIGGVRISGFFVPMTFACAAFAIFGGRCFTGTLRRSAAFLGLFFVLCFYAGVLNRGDIRWLRNLIFTGRRQSHAADVTNN